MGRDKCLVEWEGTPLWKNQLSTLRELSPSLLSVASAVRPDWLPPDAGWVPDAGPGSGPLDGIIAGLEVARHGLVVVLAVDLPLMSGAYLRRLLGFCRQGRGVVPFSQRGLEPTAAIYPVSAAVTAKERILGGQKDLQGWVRGLESAGLVRLHEINQPDLKYFENWNSPADCR